MKNALTREQVEKEMKSNPLALIYPDGDVNWTDSAYVPEKVIAELKENGGIKPIWWENEVYYPRFAGYVAIDKGNQQ
jgi:hypothetical protein